MSIRSRFLETFQAIRSPFFIFSVLITFSPQFTTASYGASYFRFWRGEKLESIDHLAFQSALNSKLLPATANLFQKPSGLTTYMPFLFTETQDLNVGLPAEMALLEYTDEETYLAYRSTEEGVGYGNLHWEMFERSKSGSLVPQTYTGSIEFNKAYSINLPQKLNWSSGPTYVRVYSRVNSSNISDEYYVSSIREHIDFVQSIQPQAHFLLVTNTYVIEYILWRNADQAKEAEDTVKEYIDIEQGELVTEILDPLAEISAYPLISTPVFRGNSLSPGNGVRFSSGK